MAPGNGEDPRPDPLHRDPTTVPAYLLARAGRAATVQFADRLAEVGLTPHTFAILLHLARDPVLTSAELARRLELTPQSTGALMRRLTVEGWIDRHTEVSRGQRIDVRITEAGRQALARTRPALHRMGDPATLGLTTEEAGTLAGLLHRVLGALDADPPQLSDTTGAAGHSSAH